MRFSALTIQAYCSSFSMIAWRMSALVGSSSSTASCTLAHRADRVLQAHRDQVHGLGRVDLALRVLRQGGGRRDDVAAAVGHRVQRAHPLGDRVAELPRGFDDLIENAMRVSEVAAYDVPVRLLALHLQFQEVDQHRLHVLAELLRRNEPLLGVLTAGGLGTRAARCGALGGRSAGGRGFLRGGHAGEASSPRRRQRGP